MLTLVIQTQVDISASNIRYGYGLFETIRIRNGFPLWLDLHLERMASGCRFFGIDIPPPQKDIETFLMERTGIEEIEEGALRLYAIDGTLISIVDPTPVKATEPVGISISKKIMRLSGNPLNRFKTMSYAENRMLQREAEAGCRFDAIALNEKGQLTDGGRSSLFLLQGDTLVTPRVSDGALPGVARRILLESGLAQEATLAAPDLLEADTVFLCNALRGLIRVDTVEGLQKKEQHPLVARAYSVLK